MDGPANRMDGGAKGAGGLRPLAIVPGDGTMDGADETGAVGEEVNPKELSVTNLLFWIPERAVAKGAGGDELNCPPDVEGEWGLVAESSQSQGE